jgi:hypothetical protein
MPAHVGQVNVMRARVRSLVEHVFATEKRRMGFVVHCIGLVRATARITLANLRRPRLQHAPPGLDRGEICARLARNRRAEAHQQRCEAERRADTKPSTTPAASSLHRHQPGG